MSHAAEFDAHGHKDHGHVIVSIVTLRLVLGALLFFTLLTSGAAEAEKWIAHVFHVEIPVWFNVTVALGIAAVKTTLVVLFFMQLKYDNPLNSMIFIFTLMTVVFFLGFTTMDLGGRGTLEHSKAIYEVEGGSGNVPKSLSAGTSGVPITEAARLAANATGKFDAHAAEHAKLPPTGLDITDAGYLPPRPVQGSSANLSRPVKGITIPTLPGYVAPGAHHPAPAEHAGEPGATPAVDAGHEAAPATQPKH